MSDRIRSLGDFLSLLRGVKADRDGEYKALCPGHDDHEPSFSVREADGKILVQCFAGCKPVDILKPLNLEVKDLFLDDHKSKVNGQKKLVATFSYEIEKGKEAFQIRRYDLGNGKKTFEAWRETVGDRPVTAAELVAHLNDSAELRLAMSAALATTGCVRPAGGGKQNGSVLGVSPGRRGAVVNDHRVPFLWEVRGGQWFWSPPTEYPRQ
jgi:hypothetical protein